MKKFIGNVNGVEYTDRETFNEAVKKAMEKQDEPLSITSYEKIIPDEKPEVKVMNILTTYDFLIELNSDKTTVSSNGDVVFNIPDGLKEKLKICDNKEEVRNNIYQKMEEWSRCLSKTENNIKNCDRIIEEETANIERHKKHRKELIGGIEYYKKLMSFIDEKEVVEESKKDEQKKDMSKPKINKDLVEIFETFGSYLKRRGFFEM
jgi:hypothetical protein